MIMHNIKDFFHWAEAIFYSARYRFPAWGLKVIGVTGTNGKTTTSFMIQKLLMQGGYKTGIMTTVAYGIDDDLKPQKGHMTTLPARQLMREIKAMRAQGIEWLVLETSSHALAQHRVWGIPYSVAVWTNLTHEHLDYHRTFERYRTAKLRLFNQTAANRRGLQTGVVNIDDPSWEYFARAVPKVITYGLQNKGDVQISDMKTTACGSTVTARYGDRTWRLQVNLPGQFNIANALAAAAAAVVMGLTDKQIEQGLAALQAVPGRMERVEAGQDFGVYVDYAVTPDALEKALGAVRAIAGQKGRVFVVFGATGDRDKTKREPMGEVAAQLSDKIYLTDDETYTEDPAGIRKSVMVGITRAGGATKTREIADRREAIRAACTEAKPGDAVLLAGLGHQTSRSMGGRTEPWNERLVTESLLQEIISK